MTPKEILIAARKLIENEDNWIKEDYDNGRDGHCAVGALMAARGGISVTPDIHGTGYSVARRLLDEYSKPDNILELNDDPSTTHADVLAVFDKAINSLP